MGKAAADFLFFQGRIINDTLSGVYVLTLFSWGAVLLGYFVLRSSLLGLI